MSDGVPKSRVTLTYDTRQPEGRDKPRELPLRVLVLGDIGGEKANIPVDARRVRQLNGRNLGEVIKGLRIRVPGISLGEDGRKLDLLIDSMSSFSPDSILRTITGQKAQDRVDPALKDAWGKDTTAEELWPGDPKLTDRWALRESVVAFQKSYQNSKTLRSALKSFGTPAQGDEATRRSQAIEAMKQQLAARRGSTGTTTAAAAAGTAAKTPEASSEGGTK